MCRGKCNNLCYELIHAYGMNHITLTHHGNTVIYIPDTNHYTYFYRSMVINTCCIREMVNLTVLTHVRYMPYIIVYHIATCLLHADSSLVWGTLRLAPIILLYAIQLPRCFLHVPIDLSHKNVFR